MKKIFNYLLFSPCLFFASCGSEQAQPLASLKLDSVVQNSPQNTPISAPVIAAPDSVAADSQPNKKARPAFKSAEIKFVDTVYNFGNIKQGESREYSFKFKNIGDKPLEISKVEGSCGCTVGSYPFLPISKNEENAITARFDSKGKINKQETYLLVHSNALNSPHKLILKSVVVE